MLLCLLTACGYSRAVNRSSLVHGRTLYPGLLVNRTVHPNVETDFRKALQDELALHGENIRSEKDADLIFSGELSADPVTITSYSEADKAMLHGIALTAVMQLTENKSGRVIWKHTVTQKQDYPATIDLGLQRNSRDAAISALCTRIARIVVQQMNQDF